MFLIRKKMGQKELITQYSFPMGIGGQGGGGGGGGGGGEVIPHFSLPELTPIPGFLPGKEEGSKLISRK